MVEGLDGAATSFDVRLPLRPPFDGAGLAAWFAARAVLGVEHVDGTVWTRAVRCAHGPGVLSADLGDVTGTRLPARLHLADPRDEHAAVGLVRRLLDLDADPSAIDAHLAGSMPALAPLVAARPGVRLPGTPSLAEALLWAITGQQISAAHARDFLVAATDLLPEELPAPLRTEHVTRLPVDPVRAAAHAESWYRGPGARRRTIQTAVPAAPPETDDVDALRAQLVSMPGIGPWTAEYALLRGVGAPDLSAPRDVALLSAARDLGIADTHESLVVALRAAAPWRSYAVMHLWHHAAGMPRPSRRRGPTDRR